jgi:predicted secreted hydrolase
MTTAFYSVGSLYYAGSETEVADGTQLSYTIRFLYTEPENQIETTENAGLLISWGTTPVYLSHLVFIS